MPTEVDELRAELIKWRQHFQKGSFSWSLAHHVTAYGAAILSATIGFIVQRPETWTFWNIGKDDLATWLAFLAALLAAMAATGGFERKWHSNRLSRSKVDLLRVDLTGLNPDLPAVRLQLKQIIMSHDRAIVGLLKETEVQGAASALARSATDTPRPANPKPSTAS